MAIKPNVKTEGQSILNTSLSTVNDILNPGVDLIRGGIYTVDSNGAVQISSLGKFGLNPESWKETKTSNWAPQQVPGQSDPILQWIHSGPRTVSFEALITKDTSDPVSKSFNIGDALLQRVTQTAVGQVASAFFNIANDVAGLLGQKTQSEVDMSISDKLDYFRSLLYPVYDDNTRLLQQSPPLVVLDVGSTLTTNQLPTNITPTDETFVVTNLEITVTKQFPNLDPMEAIVNFQLMEYRIISKSRSDFFG